APRALHSFPTRRSSDLDGMLDAAFAVGRAASPIDRFFDEVRTITRGTALSPSVVLDEARLKARVHEIAAAGTWAPTDAGATVTRSEEHTSELQSPDHLV